MNPPCAAPAVDDVELVDEVCREAALLDDFLADLCLEASPAKSYTFGSSLRIRGLLKRRIRISGQALAPPVQAARVLGAHVTFANRRVAGTHNKRVDAATRRANRAQWLPLRSHQRELAVALSVLPMGHYGALTTSLPAQACRKFRAACVRATWGRKSALRAPELVHYAYVGNFYTEVRTSPNTLATWGSSELL